MVPFLAICALVAVGMSPTSCGDVATVQVRLQRSSPDSSARGGILVDMDPERSTLKLRVGGLEPESEYLLLADDVERARFTTDARGHGKLRLEYPAPEGVQPLEFDPRGKLLSVSDGSEEMLSAVISGPLEPPGIRIREVAGIPATEAAEGGSVHGAYGTLPYGRRAFKVRLRDMAPGTYAVLVEGAPVGEVEVDSRGRGALLFLSGSFRGGPHGWGLRGGRFGWFSKRWAQLDFEPRGAWVEVVRDGEVLFAGAMRARVALPEEDACPVVDIEAALTPVHSVGSGEASMVSKDEVCEHEFRVTVRGLGAAYYDLWVGEAMVGSVPVRSAPGGNLGEIRFDTDPDDPDELPLEFDPRGQLIEVRWPANSLGLLFLEALFPME
jgi:hypothetical protein